jgi:hypothetical protein
MFAVMLFGEKDKPFCATVTMCTLLGVGEGAAEAVDVVELPPPEPPYCAFAVATSASRNVDLIADMLFEEVDFWLTVAVPCCC